MASGSSVEQACINIARLKNRIVELDNKARCCCEPPGSDSKDNDASPSLVTILGRETLEKLQNHFAEATGLPNVLVDPAGTIISLGGHPVSLCMDLIRNTKLGASRCQKHLDNYRRDAKKQSIAVKCCHAGILDAAVPVVVHDEIKGFLLTGQVFEHEPDRESSMRYARELGIPPDQYWELAQKVPIMSREKINSSAKLLQFFANELADRAMTSLKLRQAMEQRSEVEEKLRIANARQEAIIDAIPGYVCFVDNDFIIQDANKKLQECSGMQDKESIIGRPCYELFSDYSEPCPYCVVPQALASGLPVVRSSCFGDCLPDDKKYRFFVAPVKDAQGETIGAVEAIMDITDLNLAQEALKKSESKYYELYSLVRLMADNVPDLIWAKDMENNFLFANKAICDKLLKCDSTEDPLGNSDIFFAKRERDKGHRHTFGEICINSDEIVKETREAGRFLEDGLVRGKYLALDVHKAPFYAPDGKMIGTVGAGRDVTEDIRLQKALEESEKRYRLLAENVRDVIWTMDGNMRMTYASPSMVNLTGYTAEEMTGLAKDSRLAKQVEATFLLNAKRQLEADGAAFYRNWEFEWTRKEGGTVWIETTTSALCGEDGRQTCIIGVSRDVTDRKRFEQALTLSEERSRALLEAIPDLMIVVDDTDKVVKFKFGHSKRHIYMQGDITGMSLEEALPERIMEKARPHLEKVRETGAMQVFEYQSPLAEYGVRDFEARLVRCRETEVLAIVRDMTVQRRAETALYEANQRLRLAMVSANQGKWEIDFSKKRLELDENCSLMLGYEPEEVMETLEWWSSQIHPDDLENARASIRECFQGRVKYFSCEYRIRKKDGNYIWVAGSGCVTRRHENGDPLLFIGTHRDITERIKGQVELEKIKEIALAANRSKTEYLANMSHDVRTPLNGILGMLQLLASTELSSKQRDFAETALDSCLRLVRLLSDIVDIAKIEAGQLTVREDPFDVRRTLDSIKELLRTSLSKKKLGFSVHVDERIPQILIGDESRVRQILFNLVGNAIKYTDHGEVLLEMYPLQTESKESMRVLLSVSDTGIGIPDNMLERVFDTFTRDQGPYVQQTDGSGLGLYIVRQLAQLLGGEVSLASREGYGTEVHFCLPFKLRTDETSVQDSKSQVSGVAFPEGIRVLLAEDDFTNRMALEGLLARVGCKVVTVHDGAQALEKMLSQPFDCVLMDIQMPVMDGVSAVRKLRNDIQYRAVSQIPVVAMTAFAMKGDRERFLKEGMDNYLAKPIELKDLVKVLNEVFQEGARLQQIAPSRQ